MGSTIDLRLGHRCEISISAADIYLPQSIQSGSDFGHVEHVSIAKMKLLSEGRRGHTQCAIRRDALERDASEPKLITLGNGSDDEDALLPISESKGLRRRGVDHNLKISR